jgi:hypothetical protein
MATKNEKTTGIIIGTALGLILGNKYVKNNNLDEKDKWKYILAGGLGGTLSGYGLSVLFGSSNDTVNYILFNRGKRVYDGVTYKHRILARKLEHLKKGKVFTKMIFDKPKPRIEAFELEKKIIKKHRSPYNIQHNN